MDGILEQIFSELKEIKQLLADNKNIYNKNSNGQFIDNTMKIKDAAEYLGIAEHRLRLLTKQGEIKHFTAGNKFLYKRKALDQWLDEVQEASIVKKEDMEIYGKIRKIKE